MTSVRDETAPAFPFPGGKPISVLEYATGRSESLLPGLLG